MELYDQHRDFVGYGPTPPRFSWPHNARIAVSIVVNYEEGSERSFAAGDKVGETEVELGYAKTPGFRDLAVESAFQYGSRVGFWRLMRLIDSFGLPVTFFATAVALELNAEVVQYLRRSQHEVACHGWRWDDVYSMPVEQEWRLMQAAICSIQDTIGVRPYGWYSRTHASEATRELLLREGGFVYDSDSLDDDVPYLMKGGKSNHVVVPYTTIYNDSRFLSTRGSTGPTAFVDYCVRGLDYLVQESPESPRMMTIGLHPRIIGHPPRMSSLQEFLAYATSRGDVWFATRLDIAKFWLSRFS